MVRTAKLTLLQLVQAQLPSSPAFGGPRCAGRVVESVGEVYVERLAFGGPIGGTGGGSVLPAEKANKLAAGTTQPPPPMPMPPPLPLRACAICCCICAICCCA